MAKRKKKNTKMTILALTLYLIGSLLFVIGTILLICVELGVYEALINFIKRLFERGAA